MVACGLGDHYGVLEVERDADETTIKKAYRKLVLLWHPDKHPSNRDTAEEKIRQVNDAYETLSNPFKRNQYDQQLLALERKARGFRLDTTGIKPRMCIPKEFMLSPMGHPEKFVRTVGLSVFVHARADIKMEFYDFFNDAKFSLWWLPEVNNMCRLRPTSTAGVGQDGGMNFNFALHRTISVSEVNLSPGTMPESANVIAVASPVFQGAFRFEAAHFPGHYLAFKPPTHLRMVGGVVEETTAIDFMLVDYSQMFQYITAEEVLIPAVTKLGGEREYVSLNTIRSDSNVILYFQNVLKKVWSDDDFETFFESRSLQWSYNWECHQVRLRSKHEQLANSLRRARHPGEVAAAISSAVEFDVCQLPLDVLEAELCALAQPPPPMADVTLAVNILDAQKKVLIALPRACEKAIPFRRLLTICEKVATFGGEQPDKVIAERRSATARELGEVVSDEIHHSRVSSEDVTLPVLATICQMPLSWKACCDKLTKLAMPLLEDQHLEVLVPFLRSAVKSLPHSALLAESIVGLVPTLLLSAKPAVAVDALDAMVSGGIRLNTIPSSLEHVMHSAPFGSVAAVVAGLGERGMEGEDLIVCTSFVGSSQDGLESLPPAVLLRLSVAATKSAAVAAYALDGVAGAARLTLPGWSMDDASKLLLAIAKAKGGTAGEGVASLYRKACIVLALKLQELSSVQLIKVIFAIQQVPACRVLLEAAASEIVRNRLQDLPIPQLQLLTQGLLPLGGDHPALSAVLDLWASKFNEISRAENLLTESMGVELVRGRRVDLEAKGQLTADQLAKLAQNVAPRASGHTNFWQALARRFVSQGKSEGVSDALTSAGRVALEAAFPRGGGPEFEGKAGLMEVVLGGTKQYGNSQSVTRSERDRDKDRERDRDRDKDRDREKDRREKKRDGGSRGDLLRSEQTFDLPSRVRRDASSSDSRRRRRRKLSEKDDARTRANSGAKSSTSSSSFELEKQYSRHKEKYNRKDHDKKRPGDTKEKGREREKDREDEMRKRGVEDDKRKREVVEVKEVKEDRKRRCEANNKKRSEEEVERRRLQRERRKDRVIELD